jgi:hypothetical protein
MFGGGVSSLFGDETSEDRQKRIDAQEKKLTEEKDQFAKTKNIQEQMEQLLAQRKKLEQEHQQAVMRIENAMKLTQLTDVKDDDVKNDLLAFQKHVCEMGDILNTQSAMMDQNKKAWWKKGTDMTKLMADIMTAFKHITDSSLKLLTGLDTTGNKAAMDVHLALETAAEQARQRQEAMVAYEQSTNKRRRKVPTSKPPPDFCKCRTGCGGLRCPCNKVGRRCLPECFCSRGDLSCCQPRTMWDSSSSSSRPGSTYSQAISIGSRGTSTTILNPNRPPSHASDRDYDPYDEESSWN